ncbi:MAG: serine/threonine protein kinase [Alphaproteobacteria bacterium]|nr:serine/threonine protein kinase [Alphaproteobacteria bacterium]
MARMEEGSTVSGYTLIRILGRGARAVVWEAVEASSERHVALKVLDSIVDSAPARLRAEYMAQSEVDHPNVVKALDLVEVGRRLTLVSEVVDGPELGAYIREQKPDRTAALRVFGGILRGMAAAHERGLVHRDLKPSNILMTRGPRAIPKISDFGMVKTRENLELTEQGEVIGTLRYMAPEQLMNASGVDARADVFSLGCILFELLVHQRCFDAPNRVALMNVVRLGQHTPFPEGLDPELQALITRMIAADPAVRPADASAVLDLLELPSDPTGDLGVPIPIPPDPSVSQPAFGRAGVVVLGVAVVLGLLGLLGLLFR